MSGYRDRPVSRERQWSTRAVEQHLRLAGEVQPHQRIRVKRFRERTAHRVWLALELRSGDGRFERAVQLAEGPRAVCAALERPCEPPVTARPVTVAELPAPLRERVERAADEQRALGYEVEPTEVRHLEQTVLEVRYRVGGDGWTEVWLATDEPCVLAFAPWERSWSVDRSDPRAVEPMSARAVAFWLVVVGALWLAVYLQ